MILSAVCFRSHLLSSMKCDETQKALMPSPTVLNHRLPHFSVFFSKLTLHTGLRYAWKNIVRLQIFRWCSFYSQVALLTANKQISRLEKHSVLSRASADEL